jgi:hypothetical protein
VARAGRRLFSAPSDIEIFRQIRKCEVPPLAELRPDVPARLTATIHRALSIDPGDRFASAGAMASEMIAAIRGEAASPWEVEDVLAREVSRVRAQRDRLPLPASGLNTPWKPPVPTPVPEAAETGPQRIFANRALAVEFVEFSDSDITTMPEYQPDVADTPVSDEVFDGDQTGRASSTSRMHVSVAPGTHVVEDDGE